jgi:hypothetical protein
MDEINVILISSVRPCGSPRPSLSPFGRDGRASASEGKGMGEGRGGG